jgi:hypothetical protein
MEAMKNAHKILIRKPEGKRPLGGHRCRCEVNTYMKEDVRVWTVFKCLRLLTRGGVM